jgi:hypothetical protein
VPASTGPSRRSSSRGCRRDAARGSERERRLRRAPRRDPLELADPRGALLRRPLAAQLPVARAREHDEQRRLARDVRPKRSPISCASRRGSHRRSRSRSRPSSSTRNGVSPMWHACRRLE